MEFLTHYVPTTKVLVVSLATLVIYKIFYKNRNFFLNGTKIPGPLALPLIGSAFYFIGTKKRIIDNVVAFVHRFKSPWKIWLGWQLLVVVTEPEDVEIILNSSFCKPDGYKFAAPLLGEGLFTGPVDKWKRHRRVITSTFNMQILNGFVEIFSENAQRLVERLQEKVGDKVFDVAPFLTQSALETTCETAMGRNSSENFDQMALRFVDNFSRCMELIYIRIFHFWLHPNFIWNLTPYAKELENTSASTTRFVKEIVAEKKEEYHQNKECHIDTTTRRKAFLDHIIELSEESEHWPDEEIIEEAQTMVAAGSESLGSTDSFVLIMLGLYPEVQEKVYEEVYAVFGDSSRHTTHQDLSQMPLLERVIKETLRLFPVSAAVARKLVKDTKIKSYILPKDSICILGFMYLHRNPRVFEKPDLFDPDRFLNEEVAKRHPYSYLPFSGGPRNCIGLKYAMMAIKTYISTILRYYRVSTEYKQLSEIKLIPGIVIKAQNGYNISLHYRQK